MPTFDKGQFLFLLITSKAKTFYQLGHSIFNSVSLDGLFPVWQFTSCQRRKGRPSRKMYNVHVYHEIGICLFVHIWPAGASFTARLDARRPLESFSALRIFTNTPLDDCALSTYNPPGDIFCVLLWQVYLSRISMQYFFWKFVIHVTEYGPYLKL